MEVLEVTIFRHPGLLFCKKFGPNSRTVDHTPSAMSVSLFFPSFTERKGPFSKIFRTTKFQKKPYLQEGIFFSVNLSNSFDLHETSATGVFEVSEFESCVKSEVAPFL